MEQYLLGEAEKAGVVTAVETRTPLNPNRWGKQLAPWFNADCREKKKAFRAASFREGKGSGAVKEAKKVFLRVCKHAKKAFTMELPHMLKCKPVEFW